MHRVCLENVVTQKIFKMVRHAGKVRGRRPRRLFHHTHDSIQVRPSLYLGERPPNFMPLSTLKLECRAQTYHSFRTTGFTHETALFCCCCSLPGRQAPSQQRPESRKARTPRFMMGIWKMQDCEMGYFGGMILVVGSVVQT